jgi:Pentapeptide repeats (8 copies)
LTSANLSAANFSAADLSRARLLNTDLTGANLSYAKLTGANLITAKLTNAVWKDTTGPFGGTYSTVVSPFPTEPTWSDKNTGLPYRGWYSYRSDATAILPSLPLLGSPEAPLWTTNKYPNDGVQGTIKNLSGQRILIEVDKPDHQLQRVILEPNGVVPYTLAGEENRLRFLRAPEGEPVGPATMLVIIDPDIGQPTTYFYPPGWNTSVTKRDDWGEGEYHTEIWGATTLWVKRETDGWVIPVSDRFLDIQPGVMSGIKHSNGFVVPNDYAIFTIEVRGL